MNNLEEIMNDPTIVLLVAMFFLLLNGVIFLPILDYWWSSIVKAFKMKDDERYY